MKPKTSTPPQQPNVLMIGYTGANNTGAQALLQADIEDVRAVLGPGAHITIPTINEANVRRYLQESSALTIVPLPMFFFGAIRRMVKECDLVLLVEGSTYMDTWGSPLLWLFLWATTCAADMSKPTLAYAVDAGTLSPANQRRVKNIASRTDLIITRNSAASERLRSIGVTAPLESTADNAFIFQPAEADHHWIVREWPEGHSGLVGFAMVDFSLFPVAIRPWGPRHRCYKWPYFFSDSPQRKQSVDSLSCGYAALADHVVEHTGKNVALICMEQLDEALATQVHRRMRHSKSARLFSSRQYNASQMTCLLRNLDLLVTSRFHAAVLSLAASVPQVAVGHDNRLDTLYRDLDLREQWFIEPSAKDKPAWDINATKLFGRLQKRVDSLLENPLLQKDQLCRGYREQLYRARCNRKHLADFVSRNLGYTVDHCSVKAGQQVAKGFTGGAGCAA